MIHSEYGRYDALSDVLQTIRLHGGEVSRVSVNVSYGGGTERLDYPSGVRVLHMVESGRVRVSLSAGEHIELSGGDMVVLARGDEHSIGAASTYAASWVTGEFMV
jgi:quercetin dioxygenase-like cupin family protein